MGVTTLLLLVFLPTLAQAGVHDILLKRLLIKLSRELSATGGSIRVSIPVDALETIDRLITRWNETGMGELETILLGLDHEIIRGGADGEHGHEHVLEEVNEHDDDCCER